MEKVALIHLSIPKELKRRYGRVKVVSDLAKWYPWAAKTLELEHEILSGSIRSYVERIIETVKDRIRVFDKYFPCRCSKPEHVSNFLRLYGLFYNHVRGTRWENLPTPCQEKQNLNDSATCWG